MNPLKPIFARVGSFVASRPVLTLVFFVLLLGVAFAGASQLTTVSGGFTPEDRTYAAYQDDFDRQTMVVLIQGEISDPATLHAIDRFDRRMSNVENVEGVRTPSDRVRSEYGYLPGSRAKISAVLGTPDSTIVSIIPVTDTTETEETAIYDEAIEAAEWAAFPAGVETVVTGSPAFSAQLSRTIQSSTQTLLGLAIGLMIVALGILFRGVRLRLLPIVAVFAGIILTFGAMGFVGVPNSTLTSAVFPILIGLGIDYSVQFHQRYTEELEQHSPMDALPRALGGIAPPVLVAMLAAALGFAATWISAIEQPAFVWFAQASIIGVLMTFFTGIVVLLPVLTLYARWRGIGGEDGSGESRSAKAEAAATTEAGETEGSDGLIARLLGSLSVTTANHPALVLALAGLLMVGGLYASEDLDILADDEEFVPDDLPALLDLETFRAETGGGAEVQFPVYVSGSHMQDPTTLRWMDEFDDAASGVSSVQAVETPADAIRQANGGELPRTEAGVDRVLERMPEGQRLRFYNDGAAQITVFSEQNLNTERLLGFATNVESAIEMSQPPPGVEAELTGATVLSQRQTYSQVINRNQITLMGLIFIFSLLLLYYRHPVKATAPLVPMLFVIGWQGIFMWVLDIPVSPLGASLGALTVGIGAEYTVIMMERYYEEKARGATPHRAVETAAKRVGSAITVSGMTTVFGFSALILSPFPILSDFGYLTVGVIFLTLVAALATLPPTLVVFDEVWGSIQSYRGKENTLGSSSTGD